MDHPVETSTQSMNLRAVSGLMRIDIVNLTPSIHSGTHPSDFLSNLALSYSRLFLRALNKAAC